MAYSSIKTSLPLEEWARIMSVPGWHFNQVEHPGRPARGSCDLCWIQSGYSGDPNRIVGRDEVTQAIAEAEFQIARVCKYWPAPRWFCGDIVKWPDPSRGIWVQNPVLKSSWGYIIEAGIETWQQMNLYPVAIVYSDTDGDEVDDWATITYNLYLEDLEECETVIVPTGYSPEHNWGIRPLQVSIAGGVLTVAGPKWMFVNPTVWLTTACIPMDEVTGFLEYVDIYKHFNTPYPAARIIWPADYCDPLPCTDKWQDACISSLNSRNGQFTVIPGAYDAITGQWTRTGYAYGLSPREVALWYYAGYRDPTCNVCDPMGPALKRAIVSLANCYMSDPPCGCDETMSRWRSDREEQTMTTFNVAMAKSHFGSSQRGAVFAYSVVHNLPPLGKGG